MAINVHRLLVVLLSSAFFGGCAYAPPEGFHRLALVDQLSATEQEELNLPFDAYLVGIEKNNQSRIGAVDECAGARNRHCVFNDAPYYLDRPEMREKLREKFAHQYRPTFITHVAKFTKGEVKPCFLVNSYASGGACDGIGASPSASVDASWDTLELLGSDLKKRIEATRPTHIVVYTMGWNTFQAEALRNMRNLNRQLLAAAAETPRAREFKPLVIGVTWPSTGAPIISATDYGLKAKDADEVGAIWINAILHQVIPPLKQSRAFKVVVIGHSFGARATSRAAFTAPLMIGKEETKPTVDLLIGLQGAYSYQRFLTREDGPDGKEGSPYRDFGHGASTTYLTASRFDTAVTAALHADYFVGSDAARRNSQSTEQANAFNYPKTSVDGVVDQVSCGPDRVNWVDASASIFEPEPGTGGGAHSGIYTPATGRMTYQLILACAS